MSIQVENTCVFKIRVLNRGQALICSSWLEFTLLGRFITPRLRLIIFFSYEWKEDTQEFVSNLFVTQIVNDNGIEKRIEVYPSMPVICKIVDFDVSTEFIVNDKETSG